MISAFTPLAVGVLVSAGSAALLRKLALRAGWVDAPREDEATRKLQECPVPAIGGASILCGLLAARVVGVPLWGVEQSGFPRWVEFPELAGWAALLAAFAIGLWDDLRPGGLHPLAKLGGQALAGVALTFPHWWSAELGHALLATLAGMAAACVATNLWNTFDNADGAASGLAASGLIAGLGVAGGAAGAVLGFLPFNLLRASSVRGESAATSRSAAPARSAFRRAPLAYLGDSGSHLLGVLLLLSPGAWPAFLLPAADLARLVIVRRRLGRAPWSGDRRHLAHRLELLGWRPLCVLGALLAIGLTPFLWPGPVGLAGGLGAFGVALAASPDPDRETVV